MLHTEPLSFMAESFQSISFFEKSPNMDTLTGTHWTATIYIICTVYQSIYLYLLRFPIILLHVFIHYSVFSSLFSFCFNACSRATPVIHAVPKPASCRARHVALGHGTEHFVENSVFLFILFGCGRCTDAW